MRCRVRRLLTITLALLLGSAVAMAQQPGKIYRLGALLPTRPSLDLLRNDMLPELAKQGFVEGRNLVVDARIGDPTALPAVARDLVATKPDAIITLANVATAAAKAATSTIPILMNGSDPVELGFVNSLAQPGTNVTGTVMLGPELDRKRLQLLKEAVPSARHLAVLVAPQITRLAERKRDLQALAAQFGVEVSFFETSTAEAYVPAFEAMRSGTIDALMIASDPQFRGDAALLAKLATAAGLPTVCHWRDMAEKGCLISYGPDLSALSRRLGELAARILTGDKPAEIPIEGPTSFVFAVNLKTATALNLDIPTSLLAQADKVIE
jgi:putative tryptophan/tyrosine transport system substrate-binding protein